VGRSVDLLVMNADPLDGIRNTRVIHAAYPGGELLDREALRMEWAAHQPEAAVRIASRFWVAAG